MDDEQLAARTVRRHAYQYLIVRNAISASENAFKKQSIAAGLKLVTVM